MEGQISASETVDERYMLIRQLLTAKGNMLRRAEDPELEQRRCDFYVDHLSRIALTENGEFYFRVRSDLDEACLTGAALWGFSSYPLIVTEVESMVGYAESLSIDRT